MGYSVRTLQTLIRLRDGGAVNKSDFTTEQLKSLLNELLPKMALQLERHKTHGAYRATDREKFLAACAEISPELCNLEAALQLAEGEEMDRSERIRAFRDSKAGGIDKSYKGFTLIASEKMIIRCGGEDCVISPKLGVHVIDRDTLDVPVGIPIVSVENSECFYCLDWLKHFPQLGPCIILNRFPESNESKLWLESIPNKYYHFGDFDLGGISIYETEYKKRLRKRATFLIPDDIEQRIRKHGNPRLYSKQIQKFRTLRSTSGELTDLLKLIHSAQMVYEQEGYND